MLYMIGLLPMACPQVFGPTMPLDYHPRGCNPQKLGEALKSRPSPIGLEGIQMLCFALRSGDGHYQLALLGEFQRLLFNDVYSLGDNNCSFKWQREMFNHVFNQYHPFLCLYMIKQDYVKEYKKGDTVTIFWYSLKKLDPSTLVKYSCSNYGMYGNANSMMLCIQANSLYCYISTNEIIASVQISNKTFLLALVNKEGEQLFCPLLVS